MFPTRGEMDYEPDFPEMVYLMNECFLQCELLTYQYNKQLFSHFYSLRDDVHVALITIILKKYKSDKRYDNYLKKYIVEVVNDVYSNCHIKMTRHSVFQSLINAGCKPNRNKNQFLMNSKKHYNNKRQCAAVNSLTIKLLSVNSVHTGMNQLLITLYIRRRNTYLALILIKAQEVRYVNS